MQKKRCGNSFVVRLIANNNKHTVFSRPKFNLADALSGKVTIGNGFVCACVSVWSMLLANPHNQVLFVELSNERLKKCAPLTRVRTQSEWENVMLHGHLIISTVLCIEHTKQIEKNTSIVLSIVTCVVWL